MIQPTANPKYGEIARAPHAYVAPQLARQRFSCRKATATASIGRPHASTTSGLAKEVAATSAPSVRATDAVGPVDPSAMPTLPASPKASRRSRFPWSGVWLSSNRGTTLTRSHPVCRSPAQYIGAVRALPVPFPRRRDEGGVGGVGRFLLAVHPGQPAQHEHGHVVRGRGRGRAHRSEE